MVENQILSKLMLSKLQAIARFRNLVVHLYWEVDSGRVYEMLQNNLDDFQEFEDHILEYIQNG